MTLTDFTKLRYGMFVHYGLFSRLARGEWTMNREQIPPPEIDETAKDFHPDRFNADEICGLAVAGGMKYIVFTTMHHEGFRLYDTKWTDFNSFHVCGRDLTAEIVQSARKHGLKTGLYHSLNNWHDRPDAVDALENPADYEVFLRNTFARLAELVEKFNPIDILWYDGWWPFNRDGWQAEKMNAAMRAIQPHLLFNGRNGLPGDFGTPEQHLTAPNPWRPWEACLTLNDHWGFHAGDSNWKSPLNVVKMLLTAASGRGNILLNIGPRGDGSIPEESVKIIRTVGQWLREGGEEAVADCAPLPFSPILPRPGDRGDWDHQGTFTASGNRLFLTMAYWPGPVYTLTGLKTHVRRITVKNVGDLNFRQEGERVVVQLPGSLGKKFCPVLNFECDAPPVIYRTGGMRVPKVEHPRYDPVLPDIQY
ncbi:MAG: Alpha-L-fucosidase [Lentisphaerae bacterium ADurb.Bin242]|nr:MAG: Alpha-L-fucosidase [Lentisphaerae bacterium ADurb.Bin242]